MVKIVIKFADVKITRHVIRIRDVVSVRLAGPVRIVPSRVRRAPMAMDAKRNVPPLCMAIRVAIT